MADEGPREELLDVTASYYHEKGVCCVQYVGVQIQMKGVLKGVIG